jgi:lipoprotein signal peptidase
VLEKKKLNLKLIAVGLILFVLDLFAGYYFRSKGIGLVNTGISFGVGSNQFGKYIAMVAFLVLVFWFVYETRSKVRISTGLYFLVLGGMGNLLSRLVYGGVLDYVCLSFLPFCFNVSDVLISFGVVSYILEVDGNRSTV